MELKKRILKEWYSIINAPFFSILFPFINQTSFLARNEIKLSIPSSIQAYQTLPKNAPNECAKCAFLKD